MIRKSWTLAAAVCAAIAVPTLAEARQSQCPGGRPISIYLPQGAAAVTPEGMPLVQIVWERMQPSGGAVVTGHVDGSEQANTGLSAARAASVADQLKAWGVPAGRLTVAGAGFSQPAVNVPGAEPLNRRVEVCVTGG